MLESFRMMIYLFFFNLKKNYDSPFFILQDEVCFLASVLAKDNVHFTDIFLPVTRRDWPAILSHD